jgi:hypothetical protein
VGWELIGGDPAPGSADAVGSAAEAFRRVASLARETRDGMVKDVAQLGVGKWKGTAAAAFREDVRELPARLHEVDESYETAGRALSAFRTQLDGQQGHARAALTAAEQADRDRRSAQQRLDAARMDADSLRAQKRSASAHLLLVQAQQKATIDPVQRANLDSAVASARSRVNRLSTEVNAAEQTVHRHTTAVHEAEARLKRAQADAAAIRERMTTYVDGAVAALKQAEKYGNLPDFWERLSADAKQALITYGPVFAESLQMASELFALAGTLFPPGAVIFKSASLILGASGLLVSAATYAVSPGGLTTDRWIDLGEKTLKLGITATGLAGASKLSSASRFADASKWLERAEDVEEIARATKDHGAQGFVLASGSFVVGYGVGKLADSGLRHATVAANRNPEIARRLDDMSRSIGHSETTVLGVPLVNDMDSRATQSLLTTTRRGGGQFVFGNQAGTAPSIADHMMGTEDVADLQNQVAEALPHEAADKTLDWALDQLPTAPEPEIDIDLHPSPYGGGR